MFLRIFLDYYPLTYSKPTKQMRVASKLAEQRATETKRKAGKQKATDILPHHPRLTFDLNFYYLFFCNFAKIQKFKGLNSLISAIFKQLSL